MSLGLNACHNRLRVPSSLDLSLEFDLMDPRQVKSERFSLGFRGGTLYSYPGGQATEPDRGQMGNLGLCRQSIFSTTVRDLMTIFSHCLSVTPAAHHLGR